jgi:hypothetical protein
MARAGGVEARKYAENAKGYLAGGTVGARYTTWFGAYTRRATPRRPALRRIDCAIDQSNGEVKINCGLQPELLRLRVPDPAVRDLRLPRLLERAG